MKKIRIGFFIIYESAFPGRPLLDLLVNDVRFDVRIIVAPDIARGEKNMLASLNDAIGSLQKKYNNVIPGYDQETNTFNDVSQIIDYACICNPYEEMTHTLFTSRYLQEQGCKTFYLNYTYSVTNYDRKNFSRPHFTKHWKIFISNYILYQELGSLGFPLENYEVIGYPKMDSLKPQSGEPRDYKTVILAPHHTLGIWKDGLNIGSFDKFSTMYHEIPKKFPQILFKFRPHPLFLISLQNTLKWPTEKILEYLNMILDSGNVIFDSEPDYLDTFSESDALIHDCGSFVAEYLYTKKPCCYLLRGSETGSEFNQLGKMCFESHYHAISEPEVEKFICDVVLNGNDPMKNEREKLAVDHVIINHKKSSQIILERILEDFQNLRTQ